MYRWLTIVSWYIYNFFLNVFWPLVHQNLLRLYYFHICMFHISILRHMQWNILQANIIFQIFDSKNVKDKGVFQIIYCLVILKRNIHWVKKKNKPKTHQSWNILTAVTVHANNLKHALCQCVTLSVTLSTFLFHWKSNVQKHSWCHFDSCLVNRPGSKWYFIFIYVVLSSFWFQ